MAKHALKKDVHIDKLRDLFRSQTDQDLEVVQTIGANYDEFFNRAINYHLCMVPWIQDAFDLHEAQVLEIGCGTGAATVAVARRCQHVDAFDIDETSLKEARKRAAFLGVKNVTFSRLSETWALPAEIEKFGNKTNKRYDVVLFPAVLEHLLQEERIPVLRKTWGLLRPGGIMVVYDTPNRLYPFDSHTFRLPFAQWLPDDLMLSYISNSPRTELKGSILSAADPRRVMGRFGRGMSYHEFEVAIGLDNMSVVNDGYSRILTHRHRNTFYEGMIADAIAAHEPHVPVGFSKDYLELVLQKRWEAARVTERVDVTDRLLDGSRRALTLDNSNSSLTYAIPDGEKWDLLLDVLTHPWSSTLFVHTSEDVLIREFDLFSSFAQVKSLRIALPKRLKTFRLRVGPNPRSQGLQAWILGAGVVPAGSTWPSEK